MNTHACGTCAKFDQMVGPRNKKQDFGWCAARSVYPFREGPGQVFPPGVKRVDDPAKPAKPLIVFQNRVDAGCVFHTPKVV
jgi:hypothetical protein